MGNAATLTCKYDLGQVSKQNLKLKKQFFFFFCYCSSEQLLYQLPNVDVDRKL